MVMDTLAQAPLVAIIAYIWYQGRKDCKDELDRLRARVTEKDRQLGKFADTFDRLAITLELVKDRVGRSGSAH